MAESRDPAYKIPGEVIPNREVELARQMDEDLNFVCSVLEMSGAAKTPENIFRYQEKRQYMQYTLREIRRWLQGQR